MDIKSQFFAFYLVSQYFSSNDSINFKNDLIDWDDFESKIILDSQEIKEFTIFSKELVSIESLTYVNQDLQEKLKKLYKTLFSAYQIKLELRFRTKITEEHFRVFIGAYCTTLEWIEDNHLNWDENTIGRMLEESPTSSFFMTSISKYKK